MNFIRQSLIDKRIRKIADNFYMYARASGILLARGCGDFTPKGRWHGRFLIRNWNRLHRIQEGLPAFQSAPNDVVTMPEAYKEK